MRGTARGLCVVMVAVLLALLSTEALAGSLALTLVRTNLNNVDDAVGRYQYEGGKIMKGTTQVGNYAITRRVTTGGTTPFNAAATDVTLFFSGTGTPPQNVTLSGAHSFSNGYFYGSVAAASNRYTWLQGADARYQPTTTTGTSALYLYWTGSNQLTLP